MSKRLWNTHDSQLYTHVIYFFFAALIAFAQYKYLFLCFSMSCILLSIVFIMYSTYHNIIMILYTSSYNKVYQCNVNGAYHATTIINYPLSKNFSKLHLSLHLFKYDL